MKQRIFVNGVEVDNEPPLPVVWRMIELFLEMYPDEEYGFAHIVLSDQNLDDGSLVEVLGRHDPAFPHNPITVKFLEFLLTIPEDIRTFENDIEVEFEDDD